MAKIKHNSGFNGLWAISVLLISFASVGKEESIKTTKITTANSIPVYRCQQNGITIFSQVPCDKGASSITVKSSQGTGLSQRQANAQLKAEQNKLNHYLQRQDIDQQIAQHYRRIAQLKRDLPQQVARLKQERFRTAKLRDEAFTKLELGYQNTIKSHHEAIKSLNEQLTAIDAALQSVSESSVSESATESIAKPTDKNPH